MRVALLRARGERRLFMRTTVALICVLTCGGRNRLSSFGSMATPPPGPDAFAAEIRLGVAGAEVNRRLLGNNVQWVDRGDELLTAAGEGLDPTMLALVSELRPTVLRFPGGAHSDVFQWMAGEGPRDRRGTSEHFFARRPQPVLFGTAEFLDLCKKLSAEPIITVNAASGTPEQAADWVRAVNAPVAGAVRGPVRFWEVGNEPYLREPVRAELAVEPESFAGRANAFIRAMRAADPQISIGIPLRSDTIGGVPLVHFPGFAGKVLRGVTERYDFVAVHDAYFPLVFDPRRDGQPDRLFVGLMAAYQTLEEDLDQTRTTLERAAPGRRLPFALTEYNALYTINGPIDHYVATLGSALYLADVLRTLASRDDILMANYWSLTGNGFFGTVSNRGRIRPAYHVLRAFAEVLRGRLLGVQIKSPTFNSPAVGAVRAGRNVPTIAAVATLDGRRVRMIVLNKSSAAAARLTLTAGSGYGRATVTARQLADSQIFASSHEDGGLRWQDLPPLASGFPVQLQMPPHSLLWLDVAVE